MEMLTKRLPAFSQQLDMLDICSIISFISVCIALGAAWRRNCSSRALNGSLLQSAVESLFVNPGAGFTESDGHCQSVFSFIHPQTPPKGSSLDEKGTLAVFIKVLQHKAAYPRTCMTVHNVSKEIICLGRCCCTWKHLPAARFHQRADLWIDFPSMTSSICRAFKGSFISPAAAHDSSNMMKQLMKRHPAAQTLPCKQYRKSQDGVVAQAEPWQHGRGGHRKCCKCRQHEQRCPALAMPFLNLSSNGSPPDFLGTKSKNWLVPEQLTWANSTWNIATAVSENLHIHLLFPSLHFGPLRAWACFYAFLVYLQWCHGQPFDDLWPTTG